MPVASPDNWGRVVARIGLVTDIEIFSLERFIFQLTDNLAYLTSGLVRITGYSKKRTLLDSLIARI